MGVGTGHRGVVGDKIPLVKHLLNDWVPSFLDLNGVALIEFGTAVVTPRCDVSQRTEHVGLGKGLCGRYDRGCLVGNLLAHLPEDRVLKLVQTVLGVENLRLVLFHLRCYVPLAADQGLASDVVLWNQ